MEFYIILQMPLQSELFAKLMNEEDAPEVSQVALSQGYVYNSESFWHISQCYFLSKVLK